MFLSDEEISQHSMDFGNSTALAASDRGDSEGELKCSALGHQHTDEVF